ncbi:MAG: HDIG domain-containing protein [Puniceicoccales bacterium]|jgi:putative nucleotidyltransferase with HDIG domain|nr:HDIG domain-containing protein [Puniceicoccales bacterium]
MARFFSRFLKFRDHRFRPSAIGDAAARKFSLPSEEQISVRRLLWAIIPLSLIVSMICFSGQAPMRFHVVPYQVLSVPIVADFPFSFESTIQTKRLQERKTLRVAPVYKLELERLQQFQKQIAQLEKDINAFEEQWPPQSEKEVRQSQISVFLETVNRRYGFGLLESDLSALLNGTTVASRHYFWNEGINVLRLVMQEGVVDSGWTSDGGQHSYFVGLDILGTPGETEKNSLRTQEDALLYLRIHLGALDERRNITNALFHIFRHGVYANLTFDREKTEEKKALVSSLVKPVVVNVEEGEIIVNAGTPADGLELEKLHAYRQQLQQHSTTIFGVQNMRLEQVLETFCIFFCAAMIVRTLYAQRQGGQLGTRLLFLASLLVANLLLLRLTTSLWTMRQLAHNVIVFRALPFLLPIFAGVILVSFELGRRGAVIFAVLLDIFLTLMIGKNLDFFAINLFAMLLAVQQCHRALFRSQILYIGVFSGVGLGIAAFWLATFGGEFRWMEGFVQALAAIISGCANGICAIALLSPLERMFHLTSNLRLQELSDFNHKLLRQLQLYAPGTYHHSLMVASVAEQAAKDVGANDLLCRVAALFHDIGKMTKPEYFIENQTEENPHTLKAPRVSALIIKSHVREGMELARIAGIPRRVIQTMIEHHGTTLMHYFYQKAQQQAQAESKKLEEENWEPVDESFYRYDGPRPQSVESAILMLVDSCEAASRSLPKVTPKSVDDMVRTIFQNKIEDGQLDNCPITYWQIATIRKSVSSSLANILHGRVSYAPHIRSGIHRSGKKVDGPTKIAVLNAAKRAGYSGLRDI